MLHLIGFVLVHSESMFPTNIRHKEHFYLFPITCHLHCFSYAELICASTQPGNQYLDICHLQLIGRQ